MLFGGHPAETNPFQAFPMTSRFLIFRKALTIPPGIVVFLLYPHLYPKYISALLRTSAHTDRYRQALR